MPLSRKTQFGTRLYFPPGHGKPIPTQHGWRRRAQVQWRGKATATGATVKTCRKTVVGESAAVTLLIVARMDWSGVILGPGALTAFTGVNAARTSPGVECCAELNEFLTLVSCPRE
jgi:hypothetical protein